jgi:hypothetical protein
MRLTLSKHDSARRTLGRLIRAFHADDIDEAKFRAMVYGFNALLAYFKLDAELDIEARLEAIEKALELK